MLYETREDQTVKISFSHGITNMFMKLQILTSAPQVPVKTMELVQTCSMTTIAVVFLDSTEQIVKTVRTYALHMLYLLEMKHYNNPFERARM